MERERGREREKEKRWVVSERNGGTTRGDEEGSHFIKTKEMKESRIL